MKSLGFRSLESFGVSKLYKIKMRLVEWLKPSCRALA
jgi:hypothetical protein